MQCNGSRSPLLQNLAKRKRVDNSAGESFSNAEQRVLEHAADILRVPVKVLLSLNSPLSEILYESARSQTNLLTPTGTLTTTVESCPQQPDVPPVSHVNYPIPSSTLVSTGAQNAVSPLFDLEPHNDLDELDLTYLDWDQFMAPSTNNDDLLATASTAEYLAPSLSNPCEAYSTA